MIAHLFENFIVLYRRVNHVSNLVTFGKMSQLLLDVERKIKFLHFNHRLHFQVHLLKLSCELQILNGYVFFLLCVAHNLLFYMVLHRQLAALLLVFLTIHAVNRLLRGEKHFAVSFSLTLPVDFDLLCQFII